jgi:hypothetical protein
MAYDETAEFVVMRSTSADDYVSTQCYVASFRSFNCLFPAVDSGDPRSVLKVAVAAVSHSRTTVAV